MLQYQITEYTVCPGSVRTVFIKNTRRELFSKDDSTCERFLQEDESATHPM
jgi:hypothetical protein